MEIETNVNPDDDWNDTQWIEDEIDAEDEQREQEIKKETDRIIAVIERSNAQ